MLARVFSLGDTLPRRRLASRSTIVETVNQIILTLKEADTFARSRNPHHHRLAIVLLDNIIELQLRRKAETAFAFDRTNWFSGVRKHGSKQRKNVSRFHAPLLALAV